ncbi:MAG: phosphatidylinositol-3-phosphatase [Actinoplanes sp.]|jgi:acid phosphatase|nr:phosphatidylinositol-3-phosphatase [Actinoplanes sp.]
MHWTRRTFAAGAAALLLGAAPVTAGAIAPAGEAVALTRPAPLLTPVPRPDHVVIVMLENKRYDSVVGNHRTPWVTELAAASANLTRFYAEAHPSQPNYLALFSGSTQGVTDNTCPHDLGDRPNLGRQLIDAGHTFVGYAEGLPKVAWKGCGKDNYVRRHVPWVNFSNIPVASQQPFTAFPKDYRKLPSLAFVVPDLCNDMHSCPKKQGDAWLRKNFAPYLTWAKTHNSLLIVTFDEDNKTDGNHIATIVAGAKVKAGQYSPRLDHYYLLRTLQEMWGLRPIGHSAQRVPLRGLWTN